MGLMITQLHNQTPWRFDFDVDDRICPRLPPDQTRKVKLSRVRKRCVDLGSPEWPFGVLINDEPTGMYIHPYDHLLKCTQIVFKYERHGDGLFVLCAHGSQENCVDSVLRLKGIGYILGRNKIWNKRPFVEIARADSRWTIKLSTENIEDASPLSTVAAPLVLRDDSSKPPMRIKPKKIKLRITTSSAPRDRNIRRSNGGVMVAPPTITPPNPIISGRSAANHLEKDRRRLNYRVLVAQHQRIRLVYLLLFVLSFASVCFVRFYC